MTSTYFEITLTGASFQENSEEVIVTEPSPLHIRRKKIDRCKPSERNSYLRDLLKKLIWYKSAEGRSWATGKRSEKHSISAELIVAILEHVEDSNMSPVHVLESALLRYGMSMDPEDQKLYLATFSFLMERLDAADGEHAESAISVGEEDPAVEAS